MWSQLQKEILQAKIKINSTTQRRKEYKNLRFPHAQAEPPHIYNLGKLTDRSF